MTFKQYELGSPSESISGNATFFNALLSASVAASAETRASPSSQGNEGE